MNTSEQIDELAKALAKAQGRFRNAERDAVASIESTKGSYSYAYAEFAAYLDIVRAPLADNGLCVVQAPTNTKDGGVAIETRLIHESGQWIDFGQLEMSPQRPGPQALGSCISYNRKYALQAALTMVAQTDDDGSDAEAHAEHAAPSKSMHAAIKSIDDCQDYEAFRTAWSATDKAIREEISKRKPRQIQAWKERFKSDADHDQRPADEAEAYEDRTETAAAGS